MLLLFRRTLLAAIQAPSALPAFDTSHIAVQQGRQSRLLCACLHIVTISLYPPPTGGAPPDPDSPVRISIENGDQLLKAMLQPLFKVVLALSSISE